LLIKFNKSSISYCWIDKNTGDSPVNCNTYNDINVKTIKDLIGKKDLFELHSFLEFNSIDINDVPKQKIDPLTYAIEIEAPDTVILFLIEKYHTLNYETDQGKIPIFCALEHQNFKIAEALLKGKKKWGCRP